MNDRVEQKTPEATQADVQAWKSRLSAEDKKTLEKASSPKEFEKAAREIIERQLNALRDNNARRDLAQEQQAKQLLAQLGEPDQLHDIIKSFAIKQTIAARTEEQHQKQKNVFLRALEGTQKLAQQALAPLDKLIPSPLQKLLNNTQQQVAQSHTQQRPNENSNNRQENIAADIAKAENEAKTTRIARAREAGAARGKAARARAARKSGSMIEQALAAVEDFVGRVLDTGGTAIESPVQQATPAMQTEAYAELTPAMIKAGQQVAGKIQATLGSALDNSVVVAQSTPMVKTNPGVAKTPAGGGGSMTA